jgi:hypothetical protein
MVNFRYHVVSLAAVLVALAAGVILGAGPLAAQVNDAVGADAATATPSADVSALQARAAYDDAWAAAAGPRLVGDAVRKQRVVLVVAPSTPAALVKAVREQLGSAGATVGGQVQLTPAWFDPAQATVLSGITDSLAPPATKDDDGTPTQRSAAALAAAVTTTSSGRVGHTDDPSTALLAGLKQGGFLTWSSTAEGDALPLAALAVVLTPATVPGAGAAAVVDLAAAFDSASSGAVLAGATGSAATGGTVAAVRSDPAAAAKVSTVDCVDTASGRVTVVLALGQQRAGGHGQYGAGPAADAPMPPA